MSRRRRRDGGRRRSAGSSGEGPRSRPTRTFASVGPGRPVDLNL